jgi:hypothetical protein
LEKELSLITDKIENSRKDVVKCFERLHGFSMPKRFLVPKMVVQLSNPIPEFKIMRSKNSDEVQLGYFNIHWKNVVTGVNEKINEERKRKSEGEEEGKIYWKYFQELVISDSEESIKSCLDLLPIPSFIVGNNGSDKNYLITPFCWNGENSCPIEN